MNRPEIETLKTFLPAYLESIGCELHGPDTKLNCLCPLHSEKSPSFHVNFSKGVPLWNCFGCDRGGDLFTLHALRTERDSKLDFAVLAEELAEQFGVSLSPTTRRSFRRQRRSILKAQRAKARYEETKQKQDDAVEAKLEGILIKYSAPDWRRRLASSSPVGIAVDAEDEWRLLIRFLFPTDATLFVGGLYDSGKKRGQGHFRSASEWLDFSERPGSRVSAVTFQPGETSRSKKTMLSQEFIVLESDNMIGHKPSDEAEREANKTATAALFRWCVKELGMRLAAVIDTGHRSLHGWFAMPKNLDIRLQLELLAAALRLDPALFKNPAAPLRLPGAIHEKTGQSARLLYLDKIN